MPDVTIHLFHVRRDAGRCPRPDAPPREEWWAATIRPQTQVRRRTRTEALAAIVALLRDRFGVAAQHVIRYRGYSRPSEAAATLADLDLDVIRKAALNGTD